MDVESAPDGQSAIGPGSSMQCTFMFSAESLHISRIVPAWHALLGCPFCRPQPIPHPKADRHGASGGKRGTRCTSIRVSWRAKNKETGEKTTPDDEQRQQDMGREDEWSIGRRTGSALRLSPAFSFCRSFPCFPFSAPDVSGASSTVHLCFDLILIFFLADPGYPGMDSQERSGWGREKSRSRWMNEEGKERRE